MAANSASLAPSIGAFYQGLLANGLPNIGGMIYSYLAGTSTPTLLYTESTGTNPHTNPIILDSSGRIPAGGEVWLDQALSYKFIVTDASGVVLGTYDQIYPDGSLKSLMPVPQAPAFPLSYLANNFAAFKFPGGVIENFGIIGPIASGGNAVFSLAIPYPTNHMHALATPIGAANSTTPVSGAAQRTSLSLCTVYNWSSVAASFTIHSVGN